MFQLEESDFGPYRLYRFHDPTTQHGFDIVPAVAGNVMAIRFGGRNILDGYETPEDLHAGKWGKSAILFPFPNRLRDGQYSWNGRDYVFPINNATTNNAIHGFIRHESFDVECFELTEEHAAITCRFVADGRNPAYPFPFLFKVTFAISSQGEFTAIFSVTNQHDKSIPLGLGWHPYFRLTPKAEDHSLRLPQCEKIDIDERMIPTGNRSPYSDFQEARLLGDTQLDTCFEAAGHEALVRASLSAAGYRLQIEASRKSFPFFQVFTPPMRTSIAIEPMTCNVDAFHNREGLVELGAGESWEGQFRLVHSSEPG